MEKLSLRDLSLKDKRVLMRVDFNVPLTNEGTILDDSRIKAAIPSIEYILDQGASLVLISHLGRPKTIDPKLSLAPCAHRLSELLQKPVQFSPDCIGRDTTRMVENLKTGQILLLENLRFHSGEEQPETEASFVSSLAKLGNVYVNDAFGTAHRAHASTALIAKYFPGKAAAGFLMEKEISFLTSLIENPKRPFYAIIGGAKISTKIGVIQKLLKFVDGIFLGGGMSYTFLKVKGFEIGDSLFDPDELKTASEILNSSKSIYLPQDLIIADHFSQESSRKIVPVEAGIPKGWQGMDMGPKTIENWASLLADAATIFWNGPLGVFEIPPFAAGTQSLARILSSSSADVIIGGGETVAAIEQLGLKNNFTHISTGGGASLEFLEFGHLPGIDALSNKN